MIDDKYPELLSDVATHMDKLLVDNGLIPVDATRIARAAAEHIRSHWGGQLVYISKGHSWMVAKKYDVIWGEFDGKNHAALARKFDLSLKQVYKIIEAKRREAASKFQRPLFDMEETPA